jgi:hypothetical protein
MSYWRTCLLGAVAGLFSSSFCLLLFRIDEHYGAVEKSQELRRAMAEGLIVCPGVVRSPFWWVEASALHIALCIIASLLAHRFVAKRISGPVFILWQYIGLMVVAGWGLLLTIESFFEGRPFHLISPFSPAGFKFTLIFLAANVIYGSTIQIAAKRYSEET